MDLLFWEVCSIDVGHKLKRGVVRVLTNKTFLSQLSMHISCLFLQSIHPPSSSSYAQDLWGHTLWSGNTGTSKQGPRGVFAPIPEPPSRTWSTHDLSLAALRYTCTVMCHIVERSHMPTNHNYSFYSTQKYFWEFEWFLNYSKIINLTYVKTNYHSLPSSH